LKGREIFWLHEIAYEIPSDLLGRSLVIPRGWEGVVESPCSKFKGEYEAKVELLSG